MRAAAFVMAAWVALAGCAERAPIDIEHAWARATPPGSTVAAVYAQVKANTADEIVAVTTPAAERVEMHASTEEAGTMQMRPVASVALPAREAVEFKAGGLHLMLLGLRAPLVAGSSFPLTFEFRSAAPITVPVSVLAPGDDPAAH